MPVNNKKHKRDPKPHQNGSQAPSSSSNDSVMSLLSTASSLARARQENPSIDRYVANLPPGPLAEFMSNMQKAKKQIGGGIRQWPQISKSLHVPKTGVGSDLVDLTTRLWPDPVTFSNRLSMLHESEAMKRLPEYTQSGLEMRGKSGMQCEREGCSVNNPDKRPSVFHPLGGAEDGSKVVLKRCQGCWQVSYCTRVCQKSDWSRHSSFCKVVQRVKTRGELPKDGFSKLVQTVLANPCLVLLLKSYARDALQLPKDPQNGLKKNITFTFTLVEENVGELVGIEKAWVLQVSRVHVQDLDPATRKGLDVQKEFEKRAIYFQDPAVTTEFMQKVLTSYRTATEGSIEKEISNLQMALCEIQIAMTFKSDVEGATSVVETIEKLPWGLMLASPEMPQAVLWLLQFNRTIREDLENTMQCRMALPLM